MDGAVCWSSDVPHCCEWEVDPTPMEWYSSCIHNTKTIISIVNHSPKQVELIKRREIKKELSLNHWLDLHILSTTHDALRHFINFLQTKILPLRAMCPTWPSTLGPSIRQLTVCCASSWSSAGNLSRSVTPTLGCFTVVQRNSLSTRPTCRYWKVNVSLTFL